MTRPTAEPREVEDRRRDFRARTVLEAARSATRPPVPIALRGATYVEADDAEKAVKRFAPASEELKIGLRLKIGVVLTGHASPAAGTHNVILGVRDYAVGTGGEAYGFLDGFPGLLKGQYVSLDEGMDDYLNQGGADMLGYKPMKPLTERDAAKVDLVARSFGLRGLVVIGGAVEMELVQRLADILERTKSGLTVVGILQSMNRMVDLPAYIPVPLGFDTARRTLAEGAGNIAVDAMSSTKYYHFIRCGASRLTLEVALAVHPTILLLSEEINARGMTLQDVIRDVADTIDERCKVGLRSGTVLVSSDLVETLDEMATLCEEIARRKKEHVEDWADGEAGVIRGLSPESRSFINLLPASARTQILFRTDARGQPSVPQIPPEGLVADAVHADLTARKKSGRSPHLSHMPFRMHFLGQEARCTFPTQFDCELGLALGRCAGTLVSHALHNHLACVTNLEAPVEEWLPAALPLASPLFAQSGKTVSTKDALYIEFLRLREGWTRSSQSSQPGPVQFDADAERDVPLTVTLSPPTSIEIYQFMRQEAANDVGERTTTDVGERRRERRRRVTASSEVGPGEQPAIAAAEFPTFVLWRRSVDRLSAIQQQRSVYMPTVPAVLARHAEGEDVAFIAEDVTPRNCDPASLRMAFPRMHDLHRFFLAFGSDDEALSDKHEPATAYDAARTESLDSALGEKRAVRIGLVFMGRQAAGVHCVAAGVFDYIKGVAPSSELIGIVAGTEGLMNNYTIPITEEVMALYRNQAGVDMLMRSERTIRTREEFRACAQTVASLDLDGLVVVGGGQTSLVVVQLCELLAARGSKCAVSFVPASTESDLLFTEQSIGFDTMAKVFGSIVGSLGCDAASSRRYWYFVRISGRYLSHICAETSMLAEPNVCLIAEEFAGQSLSKLTTDVSCSLFSLSAERIVQLGLGGGIRGERPLAAERSC
jgi:diphosphate--fructose-6-phosphate 1-phosphotransferase